MDRLNPGQRQKEIQTIKSIGTNIENLLAKTLYSNGIRYRRNVKSVFGCPDIYIKKYKLAIFCDSEFSVLPDMSIIKRENGNACWLGFANRNNRKIKHL